MTSPGRSPLRTGALGLLGVGVVAGAIGLVSLFTGGGEQPPPVAAPAASVTAETPAQDTLVPGPDESAPAAPAPGAPAPAPAPGDPAAPPAAAAPAPAAPAPAAPAPAAQAPAAGSAAGGGSAASASNTPVRVYNNSTITGLAARAADDFRGAGWSIETVSNYPTGTIPTSTVYYRPGTGEQQAAQAMGSEFGLRAEARFDGLSDASPGLIVIVTNDYQQR